MATEMAVALGPQNGPVPRVTVVVSTFNRSNVLVHALRSIIAQSFDDWEAIVIGDHCTDDTKEVVESLADPRIRFINLPRNTGDQSGPNSVGIRLARGELIAFLSHDDLWMPEHLATLVDTLDTNSADMVVTAALTVRALSLSPEGAVVGSLEVFNRAADAPLSPAEVFVASGWLMSARLARRVGDWKPATSVRFASSQEYRFRCWSFGATIVLSPVRSFVVIPSVVGVDAYSTRRSREHSIAAPLVMRGDEAALNELVTHRDPDRPVDLAAVIADPEHPLGRIRRRIARYGRRLYGTSMPIAMRLGFAPWEYAALLGGARKGGTNVFLRKLRGLPASLN
jgi:glycosyltransferase involved in cell wall biosynthesis